MLEEFPFRKNFHLEVSVIKDGVCNIAKKAEKNFDKLKLMSSAKFCPREKIEKRVRNLSKNNDFKNSLCLCLKNASKQYFLSCFFPCFCAYYLAYLITYFSFLKFQKQTADRPIREIKSPLKFCFEAIREI